MGPDCVHNALGRENPAAIYPTLPVRFLAKPNLLTSKEDAMEGGHVVGGVIYNFQGRPDIEHAHVHTHTDARTNTEPNLHIIP